MQFPAVPRTSWGLSPPPDPTKKRLGCTPEALLGGSVHGGGSLTGSHARSCRKMHATQPPRLGEDIDIQ
eukprot:15440594-Alexandrium_andersonii.AAC.1